MWGTSGDYYLVYLLRVLIGELYIIRCLINSPLVNSGIVL